MSLSTECSPPPPPNPPTQAARRPSLHSFGSSTPHLQPQEASRTKPYFAHRSHPQCEALVESSLAPVDGELQVPRGPDMRGGARSQVQVQVRPARWRTGGRDVSRPPRPLAGARSQPVRPSASDPWLRTRLGVFRPTPLILKSE